MKIDEIEFRQYGERTESILCVLTSILSRSDGIIAIKIYIKDLKK